MTDKADDKKKKTDAPLTAEDVQKMIAAAFVRHDMEHGHCSAADGAAKLKDLED